MTDAEVASELRRLASCADIPAARRRSLERIAQNLAPLASDAVSHEREPFFDPYFRRGGLRMRLPRTVHPEGPSPLLLLHHEA